MKKILIVLLLLIAGYLTSCSSNKIKLPNLDGKSREEISEIMKGYDVKYKFYFSDKIIENDTQLDTFVSYHDGKYKAGDRFPKDKLLHIYTTVLPISLSLCYKLEMDFDYHGKSFLEDGIGEVELVSISDGDTATFKDPNSSTPNKTFRVRFLGIDTPETHGPVTDNYSGQDPWGLEASNYTKNRLNNAKTIVLEGEYGISGTHTKPTVETYGRYLGFVWVDGILLNLEIIEQGYSNSTLASSRCSDLYKEYFLEASINAMKTGRRFFGETDPGYDYEKGKFK